jgi:hypothetical protein
MEDPRKMLVGCSYPPALSDLDLIAAVDGEAVGDIVAHLRVCPFCAQRASEFAALQNLLRKQLYRVLCPSSDQLLALQQGWLDSSQTAQFENHVSSCPHCAADMRLLIEAGAIQTTAPPTPLNRLRKVIAELIMPPTISPLASAYGALRGAANGGQYAYRAENIQLMIDVERAVAHPGYMILLGLLLPDDSIADRLESTTASLLHDDTIISSTLLDELGNFVIEDIAPGDYSLSLRLPDREVVVEALSL